MALDEQRTAEEILKSIREALSDETISEEKRAELLAEAEKIGKKVSEEVMRVSVV